MVILLASLSARFDHRQPRLPSRCQPKVAEAAALSGAHAISPCKRGAESGLAPASPSTSRGNEPTGSSLSARAPGSQPVRASPAMSKDEAMYSPGHGEAPYRAVRGEVGVASWYGSAHQGKPTASRQPFDMYRLTAAHRHLPLGTNVRVTNLTNLKSVQLRINDRGPGIEGRLIDVSWAAAKKLGFVDAGLATVEVEIVSYPKLPVRRGTGPGPLKVK
jgi:rare lipoprotein A